MKKKSIVLLSLIILSLITFSGCKDSKDNSSKKSDNSISQSTDSTDSKDFTGSLETDSSEPDSTVDSTTDDSSSNTDSTNLPDKKPISNTQGKTQTKPTPSNQNNTKINPIPETPSNPTTPEDQPSKLSYDGYKLKWEDKFNGSLLSTSDWNYETHDKGWVNNELQAYVVSDNNVYLENGNLVIKAVKSTDGLGNVSYTSGRVNTQGKHDFKYGIFEVRAKVPSGQGFLPAFWMMPTNENLYGQWPRCGEIDIMEVLGNKTDTAYGTIHYGNPHRESQGTNQLSASNYSDTYHTFTCDWEPGKISWYVDGILYHTESDWTSNTVGQGEITYPAPFDQPFYMILNLAVGGNWPGNPDATTSFDNAKFVIDSVKVYQKDSYDENVLKPQKDVVLRAPDATGNFINNGDFKVAESLSDENDWIFKTALGGAATADINNNSIKISTTNQGTADYSVQLVQPNVPMKKGATYQISFDAYADANRTIKTGITAPDFGFSRYFPDTSLDLTTQNKTYTYTFKMKDSSDANGRLEFNLGSSGSTASVWISNVRIVMTKDADPNEVEPKTILADGNYIYNGAFQEGINRLAFWEIKNTANANISVTNIDNIRQLKVSLANSPSNDSVVVGQSDLALSGGKKYALSFDAKNSNAKSMTVKIAGQEYVAQLSTDMKSYTFKLTTPTVLTDTNLVFNLGIDGTTYLDNVRLVEDTMIKNGDFSAGFAGYDVYADSSADVSYIVDSLNEDNAADFTIKNTGDQDWKIQLKQNNVGLEKGKWYKLTFKAKSSLDRQLRVIMQGGESKGWATYSGENIVNLTSSYQTFEKVFQMTSNTDPEAFLSVCFGAVNGNQITQQHRVCIDDFTLEEVQAPVIDTPTGTNLLKNGDFSAGQDNWVPAITSPGESTFAINNKIATFGIANIGTADWNIQLKQEGITLEKGKKYKATFKVTSTASRTIKLAMLSTSYAYYGGADISLTADEEKTVEVIFTMNADTDSNTTMVVSMGKIDGQVTPISDVSLSDFSLVEVDGNLLKNGDFSAGQDNWVPAITSPGEATFAINNKIATFGITNVGTADWNVQLKQEGITLEKEKSYKATFKVTSTESRTIKLAMLSTSYAYYGGADISLAAGEEKTVEVTFTMAADTDSNTTMVVSMGKIDGQVTPISDITLSDFSLVVNN